MDPLDIARWQFGIVTVYHFLFVPVTIGLSAIVAGFETAWVRTRKEKYLRLVKWVCRSADHIVTVSESSKRDIVDLLGVDPEKVTNTYEAVTIPDEYRNKPEDLIRREVEGTFGLGYKEYFLFFGSIEPKKNIGRSMR